MRTAHRIAATLLAIAAVTGCATDTEDDVDNDSPEEIVTTDTTQTTDEDGEAEG